MNALIKKEIRLLLPAWIAAIVAVVMLPYLLLLGGQIPYNPDSLPLPFGLGVLFLSLASFGQEFSFKTFSLSLSQPIPRSRIWLVKIAVLMAAFATVLLTLFICYKIYFYLRPVYNIPFPIWILILFSFVIFSGGLWATLLLRQMTGAFWFAILVPAFLMLALFEFSEHFYWSQKVQNFVIPATLLVYSFTGFFFARHLFLRAQDTQWTGGEISFPWRRKASERAIVSSQPRHWFSALVRKEFQLHQANILIAALVLVLHLASVAIRKVHPNFDNPNVKFILEQVWALWLLMPLLIGSAAVAEERRLGIIESQLCLPVSRRTQLFIKFSVALVLSLILGAIMPLLIESPKDVGNSVLILPIFIAATVIFFISFYASTLARTTLQAIGITIGLFAGSLFWVRSVGLHLGQDMMFNPNEAFFVIYLNGTILFLVLVRLIFGNFKVLQENWKLWRKNFIAVILSLVFGFALANGIYFRAWELLTPLEPPHGAARLSNSAQIKFASRGFTIFAKLPDGRLWADMLAFRQINNRRFGSMDVLNPSGNKTEYIGGSNWVEVAVDNFQMLGVQSNGSLWSVQSVRQNPFQKHGDFKLTQIGSNTNWTQVAGGSMGLLLLQNNGSLWIWGTNAYDWHNHTNSIPEKLKLDLATPPTRISEETNWAKVFSSGLPDQRVAEAEKNNGGVWKLSLDWEKANFIASLQSTNLGNDWRSFASLGWVNVEVETNGELWFFWNEWTRIKYIPKGKIQFGKNEKWKVAGFGNFDSIIAIRNDGTLWKWPSFYRVQNNPDSIKPVQLGNHSDWIALLTYNWRSFALAADGSLWAWDEPSKYAWLAPSRKPAFIGNIFESTASK
jgi:ABC-type transport system involved in multi-copper enzyme maturation permease subunit